MAKMTTMRVLFRLLMAGAVVYPICRAATSPYAARPSEGGKTSVSLDSLSEEIMENAHIIYLAGGCFWGTQKFFDQFDGVLGTEVGYANGNTEAPTYHEVCAGSGHAETVKIVYDPGRITLTELLEYYFMVIDPTSVNRQGNDRGIQYRTGIYYEDEALLPEIEEAYAAEEKKVGEKLAVEVLPLENYCTAEEYHQKYLDKNPGGYCHIPGKYMHLT